MQFMFYLNECSINEPMSYEQFVKDLAAGQKLREHSYNCYRDKDNQ